MADHGEREHLVVGLMSGTSLDGVDAVLALISGSGTSLNIQQRAFYAEAYPSALHALLLAQSAPDTSSVQAISQLNVRLAHVYAGAIAKLAIKAGIELSQIDFIGSHGQTVYHVPEAEDCAGMPIRSTLQLGDPSTLAQLTKRPVVGDFRLADMALGGQGAPLVPYFDFVRFRHPEKSRLLLNLGGIGNMTLLPANCFADEVIAFDTGPGNMVMDGLARHYLGMNYDPEGRHAVQGSVDAGLLTWLLDDPYYDRQPPKSTGREQYTATFVQQLIERANGMPAEDAIATAGMLTVETVARAYEQFVKPIRTVDEVLVSGGGVHNTFLMQRLAERLSPVPIRALGTEGVDSDAKEALCFAVLAYETMRHVPSNLPSVTGASRPAVLGKICYP